VSSVVSAGFPFVVKVVALPPLWRGRVVFGEAHQCKEIYLMILELRR